ncbi:twin-arginine translocase subunit TatC [candidate division KSB1 bacterium]|nr:twin-arginine translocase subunit TatC [candidate division KSB1 bacterium]
MISVQAYLSFLFWMIIGFGVLFQLPLIILALCRGGIVTTKQIAAYRKHIIVGLLVISAVITPGGDFIPQLILAVLSYILFEISLLIGRGFEVQNPENKKIEKRGIEIMIIQTKSECIAGTRSFIKILLIAASLISGCGIIDTKSPEEGRAVEPHISSIPPYGKLDDWHPQSNWVAVVHMDSVDFDLDGFKDDLYYGLWHLETHTLEIQPLNVLHGFGDIKWSPDGKKLVMESGGHIYTVEVPRIDPVFVDMTTLKQLTSEGGNFFPEWSPDGEWIVYDSNVNDPKGASVIWKMRSDGSQKTDIGTQLVGEWRTPDWSPDGRRIVFRNYVNSGGEIYTMDINGNNLERLTFDDRSDQNPKYSPDGSKIAYITSTNKGETSIRVMNTDGSNNRQISPIDAMSFAWRPDGKKIIFMYWHEFKQFEGNGELWTINPDGSGLKRLTFSKR